jgi:hypothetical protein
MKLDESMNEGSRRPFIRKRSHSCQSGEQNGEQRPVKLTSLLSEIEKV